MLFELLVLPIWLIAKGFTPSVKFAPELRSPALATTR
jgi:hypothetical protein